jgi:hypothetical protein
MVSFCTKNWGTETKNNLVGMEVKLLLIPLCNKDLLATMGNHWRYLYCCVQQDDKSVGIDCSNCQMSGIKPSLIQKSRSRLVIMKDESNTNESSNNFVMYKVHLVFKSPSAPMETDPQSWLGWGVKTKKS